MDDYSKYDGNNIVYFDTETSIHNTGDEAVGDHKASPYHKDNYIVWGGSIHEGGKHKASTTRGEVYHLDGSCPHLSILVAQNIGFDLSYLMASDRKVSLPFDVYNFLTHGGVIWDTMIVEYLLSGQELKFASLDELATIYGGELKDSRIKEYWEAGISTEDIPEEEIIPYLESDVHNLRIIYKGQLKRAKAMGMLPLIESQMMARMATIIMEVNGMQFDLVKAREKEKELIVIRDALETNIKHKMFLLSGNELTEDECNPSSTVQISSLLFGGKVPVIRDEEVRDADGNLTVYKSGAKKGQVKTRKTKTYLEFTGIYDGTTMGVTQKSSGLFETGVETLEALVKHKESEFAKMLLEHRDLSKQLNTYFSGYSALVWPDGRIHGTINHCQTNTGRLSSSKPNLQNISNKSTEI